MVYATAAVAQACPDGYSGKFGVSNIGSHDGSATVFSLWSVSPARIRRDRTPESEMKLRVPARDEAVGERSKRGGLEVRSCQQIE